MFFGVIEAISKNKIIIPPTISKYMENPIHWLLRVLAFFILIRIVMMMIRRIIFLDDLLFLKNIVVNRILIIVKVIM